MSKYRWELLAGLTVTFMAACLIAWIHAHPIATNWDEAQYTGFAPMDHSAWRDSGPVALAKRTILSYRHKPPA